MLNLNLIQLRYFFKNSINVDSDINRVILSLRIAVIAFITLLVFATIDYFYGLILNFWVDLFCIFCYATSIMLIKNGKFSLANTIMIFATTIGLVLNGSATGRMSGNQFLWFPSICSCLVLYSLNEKKQIIISLMVVFSGLFFLEVTNYSFLIDANVTKEYVKIDTLISFVLSIIILLLILYNLLSQHHKSNVKLNSLNLRLQQKSVILSKTNKELDYFVYSVSHDLKAPLSRILGLLNIIKLESNLAEIHSYATKGKESVNKLTFFIKEILDLSRNARLSVNISPFNFKDMFDEICLELIEPDLAITINYSSNQTDLFMSDELRVKTVFNNIISNAIRYRDVAKENLYLEIDIDVQANCAIIKVKDNGIGIDKNKTAKIFEMFYRATDKNTGTGLGLYITIENINKLNGSIKVDSELNKGTIFTITLPSLAHTAHS